MKRNWLVSSLGTAVLILGTAWTQTGTARAVMFTPSADDTSPRGTTGGASRGIFTDSAEVIETSNGSARSTLYGETATLPTTAGTSMLAVMPDSFFGKTVEARLM